MGVWEYAFQPLRPSSAPMKKCGPKPRRATLAKVNNVQDGTMQQVKTLSHEEGRGERERNKRKEQRRRRKRKGREKKGGGGKEVRDLRGQEGKKWSEEMNEQESEEEGDLHGKGNRERTKR